MFDGIKEYRSPATSWSFIQRSPTDCGASLCVIRKPQQWGGNGLCWAATPQGKINPYFNCYSENTGLLRNKSENRLKVSKLCDMKFVMVSPQCNFDVDQTAEDMQMFQLIITDTDIDNFYKNLSVKYRFWLYFIICII